MPSWPPGLPDCVTADDYQEQWIGGWIKSEMESGPAQTRRRFTRARRKFQRSMIVDANQYDLFFNWWDIDLLGGTLPFDLMHPINGDPLSARFGEEPTVETVG